MENILTKKVGQMNVWELVVALFLVNFLISVVLVLLNFFLNRMKKM